MVGWATTQQVEELEKARCVYVYHIYKCTSLICAQRSKPVSIEAKLTPNSITRMQISALKKKRLEPAIIIFSK